MIKIKYLIERVTFNDKNFNIYEKLMRRYELKKKIFTMYDDKIIKPQTSTQLTKKEYSALSVCFYLLFIHYKDIRFYNTALKIQEQLNINNLPRIDLNELYG